MLVLKKATEINQSQDGGNQDTFTPLEATCFCNNKRQQPKLPFSL
jgi:hypothetical protein